MSPKPWKGPSADISAILLRLMYVVSTIGEVRAPLVAVRFRHFVAACHARCASAMFGDRSMSPIRVQIAAMFPPDLALRERG